MSSSHLKNLHQGQTAGEVEYAEAPGTLRRSPRGRGAGESDAPCAGGPRLPPAHARIFQEGCCRTVQQKAAERPLKLDEIELVAHALRQRLRLGGSKPHSELSPWTCLECAESRQNHRPFRGIIAVNTSRCTSTIDDSIR